MASRRLTVSMNKSYVHSKADLAKLNRSGKILGEVLKLARAKVAISTNLLELEELIEREITRRGGRPSFKGFQGYPAASCLSLNEAIVHGLPFDYQLKSGDVLGIDIGVEYQDWFTDGATTVAVGTVPPRTRQLLQAAKLALRQAISLVRPGIKVGRISAAIGAVAKNHSLGVTTALSGHGIGRHFHEPPQIPNWGSPDQGPTIREGEVLAIEPMFSTGAGAVKIGQDRWTVFCIDGIGAHEEATVLVTKNGARLLTPFIN